MTIAQRIGQLAIEKEISQGAREFCTLARYLALGRGDPHEAYRVAKQARASPSIEGILKAAVDSGSTISWSALASYNQLADAFLASLRNLSIFDAALEFMPRVPPRQQITVVSGGASGATIAEGNVKIVSKLTVGTQQAAEQKSVAIVAVTDELLRVANNSLFAQELSRAVTAATDTAFLSRMTTGISPMLSNGGTSTAVLQDISAAIGALSLGRSSKVFLVVSPDICKAWALKVTGAGELLFPQLTINGGEVAGCIVVPCDAVSSQIIALDATQIAASDSTIELDVPSRHASIQMDTVGDSPPTASTPFISFWQMNLIGLRVTRFWTAERLRIGAVSVISSVSYSGDSPS
jgi:hypothetical protein